MIKQKIRELICDKAWLEQSELMDDAALFSTGLIDSVDLLELVTLIEMEQQIKIKIGQLTLENFDTIDRIIYFLETVTPSEK